MNILDENTELGGGALVTPTAIGNLKKAISTATVLAVLMALNTAFGIISNLVQIFTHFTQDFGTGLPTFYKWMNVYHLLLNFCQVGVFVILLQFIGKAKKFAYTNPAYSGEQTFAALNSLFIWMVVNAALILVSMGLYRLGPLLGN